MREVDPQKQEIYSTTETVVGTWIDGKPIYRKVITSVGNIGFTVSSLIKADAFVINSDSSNTFYEMLPVALGSTSSMIWLRNGNTLEMNITGSLPNLLFQFAILEYTKTTD